MIDASHQSLIRDLHLHSLRSFRFSSLSAFFTIEIDFEPYHHRQEDEIILF